MIVAALVIVSFICGGWIGGWLALKNAEKRILKLFQVLEAHGVSLSDTTHLSKEDWAGIYKEIMR